MNSTILHSIAGYFFLLIVLRVLTRRPGAQQTPFEFVIVFLMGGIIILATVGDDRSETNSVTAVLAVGLLHRMVSGLKQRYSWLGAIIDGTPLVLMKDERWQTEVVENMRVSDDDVMAAARSKNVKTLDQVKYAILERNGGISVIKKKD